MKDQLKVRINLFLFFKDITFIFSSPLTQFSSFKVPLLNSWVFFVVILAAL